MPGRDAPVISTGVPSGSDCAVQPFVSVAAPVPEQWAAYDRAGRERGGQGPRDVRRRGMTGSPESSDG